VLRHSPDLVIVGFGLNDANMDGAGGEGEFRANLEQIVSQVNLSKAALLLLTPNFMLTRETALIPEQYAHFAERFLMLQSTGILRNYVQTIRELGKTHDIPVADVYKVWEQLEMRGEDVSLMLSNGLNHPTTEMHGLVASLIFNLITTVE
jgi:acyl-CoA thioesterase I